MVFKVNGIKYQTKNFVFPNEKDYVFLIPEPNNIFDPNAVGVFNKYHQRIGYCPIKNSYNEKMLQLIQSGTPFVCKVILSNERHQFILLDILIPDAVMQSGIMINSLKKYRFN